MVAGSNYEVRSFNLRTPPRNSDFKLVGTKAEVGPSCPPDRCLTGVTEILLVHTSTSRFDYISTSGANEWHETARARLCGAAESCATPERLNERLRTHNCRPRSCSSCFNQLVNSTVSHSCRRLVVSSAWLSLAAVCNTSWTPLDLS